MSGVMDLEGFIKGLREKKWLIDFLIMANLAGTVLGYHYYAVYSGQLADFPAYMWPVITDCPNFTLLFAVSLWLSKRGKRYGLLDGFVFVGLIYAGIWTVGVGALHLQYFMALDDAPFYIVLFFLHLAMAAEAGLLWPGLKRISLPSFALVFSWYGLNFFADYWLDAHPRSVPPGSETAVMLITVVATGIPLALLLERLLNWEGGVGKTGKGRGTEKEAGMGNANKETSLGGGWKTGKKGKTDKEIKRFVRQVLGCGCPEPVFEYIQRDRKPELSPGIPGDRINVGNRLLIYMVRFNRLDIAKSQIRPLVSHGLKERDGKGFNRFRLVLFLPDIGDKETLAKEFEELGADEKTHLHVLHSKMLI